LNKYIYLILLFISQYSVSQSKITFLEYLIDNKLYVELNYALKKNSLNLSNDSLAYYQLKSATLQKKIEDISLQFLSGKNLLKRDTFLFQDFTSLLLEQPDSVRRQLFTQTINKEQDSISTLYAKINNSIDSFKVIKVSELPNELNEKFIRYAKFQNKKPIIAAGLSILFPGLGKRYINKKHSFRFIVLSQSIFGLKMGEAIYRLGLLHPYTFLTGGVFLLYYGSSVVGSYYDCIEVQKEQKKIYINHAKDYINHTTN
jgi:hypothetical protein